MYQFLRNVHLLIGLAALWLALIYGLSSIHMAHWYLFRNEPQVTNRTVSVISSNADVDALVAELRGLHNVKGHLKAIENTPQGLMLHFEMPGALTNVLYVDGGQVHIKESRRGFFPWLNRLHHTVGLWWDDAWMNLWGVLVLVTSVAMLVMGATGIYLWWRLGIERRTGTALLLGSMIYSIGLMFLIRFA